MHLAATILGLLLMGQVAPQADPAEPLLKEIRAVAAPKLDSNRAADDKYWAEFQKQSRDAMKKRADLIWQLYQTYPLHAETPDLLEVRWSEAEARATDAADSKTISEATLKEIEAVIAAKQSLELVAAARYWQTTLKVRQAESLLGAMTLMQPFLAEYTSQPGRCILLLAQAAGFAPTLEAAAPIYRRIVTDFPDDPQTQFYRGVLRQIEGIGQPFPLNLKDVVTGQPITSQSLAGKVVLLDFMSAQISSAPQRASLLKMMMRELGPQGLMVVTICLDSPKDPEDKASLDGESVFKEFLRLQKIEWPAAFPGAKAYDDWIAGWGINQAPSLFLIDRKGRLYSTQEPANLKGDLEKLLKAKG